MVSIPSPEKNFRGNPFLWRFLDPRASACWVPCQPAYGHSSPRLIKGAPWVSSDSYSVVFGGVSKTTMILGKDTVRVVPNDPKKMLSVCTSIFMSIYLPLYIYVHIYMLNTYMYYRGEINHTIWIPERGHQSCYEKDWTPTVSVQTLQTARHVS